MLSRCLTFAVAALLVAAPCRGELVVRVHLVPAAAWEAGELDRGAFLSRGTVRFYRSGSLTPELSVPLNDTVVVPEGDWDWVAAGPRGVGWERGNLEVTPGFAAPGRVLDKKLLRPAVAACRVAVEGSAGGATAVLSLSARALFPLPGEDGWVPAGAGLALARDAGGRLRLSRPYRCRPGEHRRVEAPSRPLSSLPSLLLSALAGR